MSGESGMGWRDVLGEALRPAGMTLNELVQFLHEMPAPARIALARELLAGTGRVVARDVGTWPVGGHKTHADGWNACRAAMMEDGE